MTKPVILDCRDVWKLYGAQADSFLATHPDPSPEQLKKAGLIGAVRAANVRIHSGEIFVIMGLSGSGKSTLVRCLSRLVEPTAGEIRFEDRDLLRASEAELIRIRRKKMGMVFQQFALLPHLTVLENAAFPLDVQGVGRKTREARAREVVELVGLKGREHYYPRELSGGQQQRVGIARSLAVEPDLWFLDEPFSALDPLIRREMQDEFMRLQNILHKTIVFITHDFDEAIRLADRIAVMKDGAIEQVATPEQLVLNPATDYVAEFTRHVSRAKVLRAASVMEPVGEGRFAGDVPHDAVIEDIADRVEAADRPHRVLRDGAAVGQITRAAIIDVLVGRA
ncbi:glycine betaine/proline transport system ATP-binding protein [Cribrihabitans marinus]|uniref:Quaternary amine transport ATP-binding protein n=1 Tax=Cribrihabitans marinus TaxID=1227549 RepID=A0A1H7DDE2_9RHOB|nr:betaine/proline/choline family ABC transporter ATP-binding protein [Cribrihabitans marinus]GGH37798.1 ABC transporter ATP-binding protein [Cribrihabitans marinus]SEJ97220.1 glycine betaine/proline transport system ATP-binding protein [Cribrihabitans marinus]